tara:strand:+ start:720 stop:932 length:213 start_codon:yes stop_codon:yes gene_type:complete
MAASKPVKVKKYKVKAHSRKKRSGSKTTTPVTKALKNKAKKLGIRVTKGSSTNRKPKSAAELSRQIKMKL